MPEIDNELLAVKGLGWSSRSKEENNDCKWYFKDGVCPDVMWADDLGVLYRYPPDFATDPAACMEIVSKLGRGMSITVLNRTEGLGGGIQAFIGEHPLNGDYYASGTGVDVLHAISAAFTEYFRGVPNA